MKALMSALIALAMFSAVASAEEALKIAGDPCSNPLITRLLEKKGIQAKTETVSCTLGVYMAAGREVDMGVSTQNGLSENLPKGAVNTVIAKSPIVLIVNRKNPVNDLSYEQLRAVYTGRIRNWKDLGGMDAPIKNVMLEPCVKHTVSKKVSPYVADIEEIRPEKKGNPVDNTNRLVAENEGAIGQQIYGYESVDVKVVTIDGLLPDEKTLPLRYGFYQDYNVVTFGPPSGRAKELIDFARTEEGRKVIRAVNHIPVE